MAPIPVLVLTLALLSLPRTAIAKPGPILVARPSYDATEDGRKDVADSIAALRKALAVYAKDKRPLPDFGGVAGGIHVLDVQASASGPKDRAAIARALADVVVALLPSTTPGTLGAAELAVATVAIGKCGDPGVPLLLDLLEVKNVEKKGFALTAIHVALGKAGTDAAFEALLGSARKREVLWVHCAGVGFAACSAQDGTRRKKAFEALLAGAKSLRDERARKNKRLEDEAGGKEMLAAVGKGLAALAQKDERDLAAWEAWSKEHAKDGWTDAK